MTAIEADDFVKLRDFDWTKSFQAGPVLSSLVAIVFFFCRAAEEYQRG